MSKVKGQLLTCDRCGKSVFLKYISERENAPTSVMRVKLDKIIKLYDIANNN